DTSSGASVVGSASWGPAHPRLGQRAAGGPASGRFVVRGIKDDRPGETLAVTFRAQIGLIAQGEVDDAALARGHGSEVERRSGLANFFGGHLGGHAEFLQADGAL